MEFFRIRRDIPFMRHALVFNAISFLTFAAAVFFLVTRGLHFSIEFTGGSLIEVQYAQSANLVKAREAEGHNPLCGDRLTVYVDVVGGVVRDISFEGEGCAISTASASMMTTMLKGMTVEDSNALFERFRQALTGDGGGEAAEGLGKLAVFQGVREFPSRVKCATLAWHTLRGALHDTGTKVTTE